MSLRLRTAINTILIVSLLFFGMHYYLSHSITRGYLELEAAQAAVDIARAKNVYQDEFEHLIEKSGDWARWDDSYKFVQDHDRSFIDSNLVGSVLQDMQLDFIVLFDNKGRYVYGIQADENFEPTEPQDELKMLAQNRSVLLANAASAPVSVGVTFPWGFTILVLRPIVRTDGSGPPSGYLSFGRIVGPSFASELSDQSQLTLTIEPVKLPVDPELLERNQTIKVLDRNTLAASILIRDFDGAPAQEIRISLPRDIVAQGEKTQASVMLGVVVAGFALVVLSLITLEHSLLRRLTKITRSVRGIADHRSVDRRIEEIESDELGVLGREMNGMLDALKKAEDETVRAREIAEEAAAAKAMFLANMGHELRTPINGIVGMAQVMLNVERAPQRRESLGIIKSSGRALLELINQLLDQAKGEAGRIELEKQPFQLQQLMIETLMPLALRAHEGGLVLRLQMENVPDRLVGDALRLRQIITNLVGSGIKFTSKGSVSLRITAEQKGAAAVLIFSVQDTGIGMSPDTLKRLFSPFTQADSSMTRRYGGTGLGLSISKMLVELMGGTISVDSTEGIGTTFIFEIALEIQPGQGHLVNVDQVVQPILEADVGSADEVSLAVSGHGGLRILVADDLKVNQTVIKRLLEQGGHNVVVANSGREAIEKLEAAHQFIRNSSEKHPKFDLVLMDVQMPDLDGFEATAQIRDREALATVQRIPIVAVTAYTSSRSSDQYLSHGMDGCIEKPVDAGALAALISKLFPNLFRGKELQATSAPPILCPTDSGSAIDFNDLVHRCADDLEIVGDVLNNFLEEIGELVSCLELAGEQGSAREIGRAAHALKGSLANVSATSAAARCAKIDDCKDSFDRSAIEVQVGEISREVAKVVSFAKKSLSDWPNLINGLQL